MTKNKNQLEKVIKARTELYESVRGFFRDREYLEVETPLRVNSPGMEPNLDPFEVGGQGLITSPEYSMKKLLGSGLDKIFTITKVFRSGEFEIDILHNPEFSMLEWYEQGIDYQEGMKMTEELVVECAQKMKNDKGQMTKIDLTLPWPRYRVRDLMLEHAGIDLDKAFNFSSGRTKNQTVDSDSDGFYRIWLSKVEPKLPKDRAFFIYDYPVFQSALARLTKDGKYAERFEAYLGEVELCNAFTELVDPIEQRHRFEAEAKERSELGKKVWPIDEELLTLLSSVREPTFGNALGLDRLLMVLTGSKNIEDVLLFR